MVVVVVVVVAVIVVVVVGTSIKNIPVCNTNTFLKHVGDNSCSTLVGFQLQTQMSRENLFDTGLRPAPTGKRLKHCKCLGILWFGSGCFLFFEFWGSVLVCFFSEIWGRVLGVFHSFATATLNSI